MNSDEIKSRIEKLETEKNQLDKRQRNLEALMNKKKKDEDTRRKIVLGALILKEVTIPRQSRGHSGCEPLKAAVRGR